MGFTSIAERTPLPCSYEDRYKNLCFVISDCGHYHYEGLGYYGQACLEVELDLSTVAWHIIAQESKIIGYTRQVTHFVKFPYFGDYYDPQRTTHHHV